MGHQRLGAAWDHDTGESLGDLCAMLRLCERASVAGKATEAPCRDARELVKMARYLHSSELSLKSGFELHLLLICLLGVNCWVAIRLFPSSGAWAVSEPSHFSGSFQF